MKHSDSPAAKPVDPLIGQVFRNCRVLRKLGEGGMGAVYLAYHQGLDKKVAIKFLPADRGADAEWSARFVREARSAAALEHPGIVGVLDVAKKDDRLFLVMQYVEGETLGERVKRKGALSPREVVDIGARAARALAAAHERGIVHRDIKPDNLMLTAEGQLKIMDFGLAKGCEPQKGKLDVTREGAIVGSPHFMAPEQAEGQPPHPANDLYSLGVTLYALATGQRPFEGSSVIDILMAHRTRRPPPPSQVKADIPRDLSDLIMRLMALDPKERPESARELRDALAEIRKKLGKDGSPSALQAPSKPRLFTAELRERLRTARPKIWTPRRAMLVGALFLVVGATHFILKLREPSEAAAAASLRTARALTDERRYDEAWREYQRWREAFPKADDGGFGARLDQHRQAIAIARDEGWKSLRRFDLSRAKPLFDAGLRSLPDDGAFNNALLELEFLRDTTDLVAIPGGVTVIGSDFERESEKPRHLRVVDTFFLAPFEVTRAQWRAAREKDPGLVELPPMPPDIVFDEALLPATEVSFEQARRFGAVHGRRLPSELEWERAARSDAAIHERVRLRRERTLRLLPQTFDAAPANAFGVRAMIDSAGEWTDSAWAPHPDGKAEASHFLGDQIVVKGASLLTNVNRRVSAASRGGREREFSHPSLGFRLACSLPPVNLPDRERRARLGELQALLTELQSLTGEALRARVKELTLAGLRETSTKTDLARELSRREDASSGADGMRVSFRELSADRLVLGVRVPVQFSAINAQGVGVVREFESVWLRTAEGFRLAELTPMNALAIPETDEGGG